MKKNRVDEKNMNEYAYYIHLLNNGYTDFEAKEISKRRYNKKIKKYKNNHRFLTVK